MRRRQVLSALALSVASLAGCSAPGAPGTDDDTATDTSTRTATSEPGADTTESTTTGPAQTDAVTPDPDDPIAVVLYNETDQPLTVQVTVTRSGSVVFERSRSVAPDDEPSFDTGLSETGSYELTVAVEGGPSETVPLDIEPYDVRMGSNLIVELGTDEILILIEE